MRLVHSNAHSSVLFLAFVLSVATTLFYREAVRGTLTPEPLRRYPGALSNLAVSFYSQKCSESSPEV